jgi:hypothetical protein
VGRICITGFDFNDEWIEWVEEKGYWFIMLGKRLNVKFSSFPIPDEAGNFRILFSVELSLERRW